MRASGREIKIKTEARIFNNLLRRIPKKHSNVTIIEIWTALDRHRPKDIFETDNFHLDANKEGTTEVANIIVKHTKTVH